MRATAIGTSLFLAAILVCGGPVAGAGDDQVSLVQASRESDEDLDAQLAQMIASAEVDPDGKLQFNATLDDPRFLERDSGHYWQVSGEGLEDVASRSLWERRLALSGRDASGAPVYYDSDQFPGERLRVAERTVRLQGSDVAWRFAVAKARGERD